MKRIVFLGTPCCAAKALEVLLKHLPLLNAEVGFVVCHNAKHPDGVQALAVQHGLTVLTPATAKDPDFLNQLKNYEPDLCITAAYGLYLPGAFLQIPRYGTLNIHPSLLPLYRGASPVQRSLQEGQPLGVSVLKSVAAMDAGPICFQETAQLLPSERADSLLERLFIQGMTGLLQCLPALWENSCPFWEQDHSCATHAKKIESAESFVDVYSLTATQIHNAFLGFWPWPGVKLVLEWQESPLSLEVKIHDARILSREEFMGGPMPAPGHVVFSSFGMVVGCLQDSAWLVSALQPSGKKVLSVHDFKNGLQKRARMACVLRKPVY